MYFCFSHFLLAIFKVNWVAVSGSVGAGFVVGFWYGLAWFLGVWCDLEAWVLRVREF